MSLEMHTDTNRKEVAYNTLSLKYIHKMYIHALLLVHRQAITGPLSVHVYSPAVLLKAVGECPPQD